MLQRLLGPGTSAPSLKQGLDRTSSDLREVTHRLANASTPGFQSILDAQGALTPGVNLEEEMVNLADGQLRFEAQAQMLQRIYQQIRSSVGPVR
jgi:flagellar hook-associated protein FlgK